MATYVIGDVQGSYRALRALVEAIAFDPEVDELWLAGDLVNRGPDSHAVLQWAHDHRKALRIVLGNHDLYLIARWLGVVTPRSQDTLEPLLNAPDADTLVGWLREQPLMHRRGDWVMVHAALHPAWSLSDAEREARELEGLLAGERAGSLLKAAQGSEPRRWAPDQAPRERQVAALATFTRLRCLDGEHGLTFDYTGPLSSCPKARVPWWRAPHPRSPETTVIIGHWAALGYHREPGLLAMDTGCAWGRHLSALALESGALTQVRQDGSLRHRGRALTGDEAP